MRKLYKPTGRVSSGLGFFSIQERVNFNTRYHHIYQTEFFNYYLLILVLKLTLSCVLKKNPIPVSSRLAPDAAATDIDDGGVVVDLSGMKDIHDIHL